MPVTVGRLEERLNRAGAACDVADSSGRASSADDDVADTQGGQKLAAGAARSRDCPRTRAPRPRNCRQLVARDRKPADGRPVGYRPRRKPKRRAARPLPAELGRPSRSEQRRGYLRSDPRSQRERLRSRCRQSRGAETIMVTAVIVSRGRGSVSDSCGAWRESRQNQSFHQCGVRTHSSSFTYVTVSQNRRRSSKRQD